MNHNLTTIPRYKLRGPDEHLKHFTKMAIQEFTEDVPEGWISEAMSYQGEFK